MSLEKGWFTDRGVGRGRFILGSGTTGGGAGGGDKDGRTGIWLPTPATDRDYTAGLTGVGYEDDDPDGTGSGGSARFAVLRGSTLTDPFQYDLAYSGVPLSVAEFNLFSNSMDFTVPFTRADFIDFVMLARGTGEEFRGAATEDDFYITDIFLHNPVFDGGSYRSQIVDGLWHTDPPAPDEFDRWETTGDLRTLASNFFLAREEVYKGTDRRWPSAAQWSTWDYAANGIAPTPAGMETGTDNWDLWGLGGKTISLDVPARNRWVWAWIFDFGARQPAYPDYDFGEPYGNYNDGIATRTVTLYNNFVFDPDSYTHDAILNPTNDHTVTASNKIRLDYFSDNVAFQLTDGVLKVYRTTSFDPADDEVEPIKSIDVSTAWSASGALFSFDRRGVV